MKNQVFTPHHIVNFILDEIGYTTANSILGKTILEPSCGTGNFLVEIVNRIIKFSPKDKLPYYLSFIEGWDIDETMVSQCYERLNQIVKFKWNLKVVNSVTQINNIEKYDYVVGNPPYVNIHEIDDFTKSYIKKYYQWCNKGTIDLYYAFLELGFKLLNSTGKMCVITPSGWQKSNRDGLVLKTNLTPHITKTFDHESNIQFDGVDTYTSINVFEKNLIHEIKTKSNIKSEIEIKVGIQTLNDKWFIFDKFEVFHEYYSCVTPIGIYKFEKDLIKDIIKCSTYGGKQHKTRKAFYPYENNMLLPQNTIEKLYPNVWKYVCDIKSHIKNNKIWYGYGRVYNANFGKKIIYSPISKNPTFYLIEDENTLFYSGYAIMSGDLDLLQKLNSENFKEDLIKRANNLKGGYYQLTKWLVEECLSDFKG